MAAQIDYFGTAESSFPGGFDGGDVASEYKGIVIIDILMGKGFNKLSSSMDKIDPYLKVRIHGCEDEFQTDKKDNEGKPVFNQRFTFRIPNDCEADHVNIKLMDDDGMSSDDHKASGKVPFPAPFQTFAGRVDLDEDKYNEEAEPVVEVAIIYMPFEEAFKAPNVISLLGGRVAELSEDDAADEAQKAELKAQLEALEADDEADEAEKAALAQQLDSMAAASAEKALAAAEAAAAKDARIAELEAQVADLEGQLGADTPKNFCFAAKGDNEPPAGCVHITDDDVDEVVGLFMSVGWKTERELQRGNWGPGDGPPPGLSVQSDGDNAFHFNENMEGENNGGYTIVAKTGSS